jgi:uncharacterized membrane protein
MITVVSVTFSVTIVALTVASQHFGPRLLNNFMRDAAAQSVLGTFIATFAYCLVVLRVVYGEGEGREMFVPHLAVTGAVLLTLASVATLIYYVHHVSASIQVASIARGVTRDLEAAIARLYPERIGTEGTPEDVPLAPPPGARPVAARDSGYVQQVESDVLVRAASEAGVVVWMHAAPGSFLIEGAPVAYVCPPAGDHDALSDRLNRALVIGSDRSAYQDVGFPVQQLVEVALHALSPGLNEPYTAITCVDCLGQGLSKLATRRIPRAGRLDRAGALRVVAPPVTFDVLLAQAFDPIRHHLRGSVEVTGRLLDTLAALAVVVERPGDREAIRRHADLVMSAAASDIVDRERVPVEAAFDRVRAALGLH